MKRAWSVGLLAALVVFVRICTPVSALTLEGLVTPSIPVAANIPCPEHPGYNSYSTAATVEALSTGSNADFEAAWSTALPGEWNPALWTLQWSGVPLDATLNITAYQAINYTPDNPLYSASYYAGAEINISWVPTASQQNLKWIQAIYTNRPRYLVQRYMDIMTLRPPADQPPAYPYSYTDYHFYDKPRRACEPDQHIFWNAYLYLASIDRSTKTVTVYEGLHWGYTIDCVPVPEPSGVIALLAGLGVVTCGIRRRMST